VLQRDVMTALNVLALEGTFVAQFGESDTIVLKRDSLDAMACLPKESCYLLSSILYTTIQGNTFVVFLLVQSSAC